MDVYIIIKLIFIISDLLLVTLISYYKLKKNYFISFNSYYLLTICIVCLISFHLLSFFFNNKLYTIMILILFFSSFIIKIKRLLDCISLSKILKSHKLKNESKILFKKSYYSFETFYLIIFTFLSIPLIVLFYFLQKIIIEKYILTILSFLISIYYSFRILTSDIKKNLKRNYLIEIFIFLSFFINLIHFELNSYIDRTFYQISIFILEVLFELSIIVNCRITYKVKVLEEKFIITKKLESDFYLFFNNELCFYFFNSFLNKNEPDSNNLMKIYLFINKYKIKVLLNENVNELKDIIDFYDKNKKFISNEKLKQKLEEIFTSIKEFNTIHNIEMEREVKNNNNCENNIFGEVFEVIDDYFNNKYIKFKKSKEYKKLFSLLNLLYFLDEYIFEESFYFDYVNNEELQSI